ncbi:hypothetical protein B808_460 [Fructilactobacillus florum 8D]|uniref:Uncharacterized protein n=1 Tax=Fructilactobacillus florum 8D TaxID=1221538 RepID=W9ELR2_9LACO|nr:hypothetical protein B808_460 [Fructilactobacillus florum 8D]
MVISNLSYTFYLNTSYIFYNLIMLFILLDEKIEVISYNSNLLDFWDL